MKKIILDLCGGTGAWSKPYKDNGYEVVNVTLPEYDVRTYRPPDNVYGILAAPPCDQFSFARTNAKKDRDLHAGMEVVRECLRIIWYYQYQYMNTNQKVSPLKFWCLENPNGWLKFFLGHPAMKFSPYEFEENYKKNTQLWGWFNKPEKINDKKPDSVKFDVMKSKDIHPEYFGKLTRKERRAITPPGFAKSFYEANK